MHDIDIYSSDKSLYADRDDGARSLGILWPRQDGDCSSLRRCAIALRGSILLYDDLITRGLVDVVVVGTRDLVNSELSLMREVAKQKNTLKRYPVFKVRIANRRGQTQPAWGPHTHTALRAIGPLGEWLSRYCLPRRQWSQYRHPSESQSAES